MCFFEEGRLERALREFSTYLEMTGQSALLDAGRMPFGLATARDYPSFAKPFDELLRARLHDWTVFQRPFPQYLITVAGEAQAPSLQGMRMLFVIPQYIMNSKQFIECDFRDHFAETALNAGAAVDVFCADRCTYPEINLDGAAARQDLETLAARIESSPPDVIFIDANYLPSADTLNPTFLAGLKKKHGFLIVAYLGDGWGSHWVPMADAWSEVCDLIFHIAPDSPLAREGKYPEKLCWSACPVNERSFFPQNEKRYDVSYVGSYASGLRPFWLTVAAQTARRLKLGYRLLPHRRESAAGLTMHEYAAVMRESRTVLTFSTRLGSQKAMTGRAWQALNAGVVLLEEENPFSSAYFVPFVHYVPFSSMHELAYSLEFFFRNPNRAKDIGAAASRFCRERYSSAAIWPRLIAAARNQAART